MTPPTRIGSRTPEAAPRLRTFGGRLVVPGHTPTVFVVFTVEPGPVFRYEHAVPAFFEALDCEPDAVLGRTLEEIVPSEPAGRLHAHLTEAFATGRVVTFIEESITSDGKVRVNEMTAAPLTSADGVARIVVRSFDIAEELGAESRIAALLGASMDLIVTLDAEGTILYMSPSSTRLIGYEPHELVGASAADLVPEQTREDALSVIANVASRPGAVDTVRARIRHRDGHWLLAELVLSNRLDDPTIGSLVVNARDLTDREASDLALMEANDMLTAIVEHAPMAVYTVDGEGRVLLWNDNAERMFGWTEDEVRGQPLPFVDLVDPEEVSARRAGIQAGQAFADHETVRSRKDGSRIHVSVSAAPLRAVTGQITGAIGMALDITHRKAAERRAERESHAMAMVAKGEPLEDVLGLLCNEAEERTGLPCLIHLIEPNGGPLTLATATESARQAGAATRAGVDGVPDAWSTDIRPSSGEGTLGAFTLVGPGAAQHGEDVAPLVHLAAIAIERRGVLERMAHQALTDPLTGLPNRLLFLDRLGHALELADRVPHGVAVLFCDLDSFKIVNDSLGHAAGDELLVAVADRIRSVLRPYDTAARFGGDEFVVLCERLENEDEAMGVAVRVSRVMRAPFVLGEHEVYISTSVGIANASGEEHTPESLIRDADAALYQAKEKGRGQCQVFDHSMRERAMSRLTKEAALRRAVERGELHLAYQPQVNLVTGDLIGREALLRWEHPEWGTVPAEEFIPVAEESGIIRQIGSWTLDRACAQIQRWKEASPGEAVVPTWVNLSGRQLLHPGLVESLATRLDRHGIAPGELCLEITESVLMNDIEPTLRRLMALREIGIHLAIDDFGTGFSSLGYLQRYPIDLIKIDKSFVAELRHDGSTGIVAAVLAMADALGLQCVAEGVEREEQAEVLLGLGCHAAQGFLFGYPLAVD